jgi:hypothetical protein
MKCKYTVSFEFDTEQTITERGICEAGSLRTIVARAVDNSIEKNPNTKWSSVVVVIERRD